MSAFLRWSACLGLFLFVGATSYAQSRPGDPEQLALDSTTLDIRLLAQDLYIPWDLVWGPDNWIWFTQRDGGIYRLNPETGEKIQLYQVEEVFESDDNSGMYALALHPDFENKPWVYVNYTFGLFKARLVRFTYDARRQILRDSTHLIAEFLAQESHNGARMQWTEEGKLLIALGDAYRAESSQDFGMLTGKILRLNPDGSIPDDNPVPGSPIYSYGHRNPQGLVITPDGTIYSSEHGTGADDEVNRIVPNRNYGWPYVEGYCNFPSERYYCDSLAIVEPLRTYSPAWAPCGMDYYDHEAIPEWRHSLIQTFLKAGDGIARGQRIEVLGLSEDGESIERVNEYFAQTWGRLRDVLVAPDGRVFLCSSNRETNGQMVVQAGDDVIIELRNAQFPTLQPEAQPDPPSELTVFPNPAPNNMIVELPVSEGEITWQVYDLTGRVVMARTETLDGFAVELPGSRLHAGTFVLEVALPDGQVLIEKIQFL